MEIENKLDEDFLFYLGFVTNYFHNLRDKGDVDKCQAWLEKLCGEAIVGVENKRNRNIYLSNLVLCMQEGQLAPPFQISPGEADISNARQVFGLESPKSTEPEWLNDIVGDDDDDEENMGRTYLATRALSGGEGAFAYLAVSLADGEPKWLGGGESGFDEHMQRKFRELIPPITEMERILARRKNPREREKVVKFYTDLLKNIADEIDGTVEMQSNQTINSLIEQLVNDLMKKGEYGQYEQMNERQRRLELLTVLHDKVHTRKQKVIKLEDALDDVEQQIMPQSFFDTSRQPEDKYVLPAAMWEQAINKPPSKKNMERLQANYPLMLIEKFLELLSNYKEETAIRMQKRHENIVSQLKKELRKDGEEDKNKMINAQQSAKRACDALADVKKAKARQQEAELRIQEKRKIPVSAHSQMYDQMRNALFDTQKSVEEEAEKGRLLAAHINAVNQETEVYMQVNAENVRNVEAVNIEIMKNIKRMRAAIKQHEGRLQQLKAMSETAGARAGQQAYFFV